MGQGDVVASNLSYLEGVVWLRSHMNRILHLYTPTRAYARPHELADMVFKLATTLRDWYQALPLEKQFPRDVVTFTINGSYIRTDNVSRNNSSTQLELTYICPC
jgi:hypothetical protein